MYTVFSKLKNHIKKAALVRSEKWESTTRRQLRELIHLKQPLIVMHTGK